MREYITIQADTWDQIALKEYQSELSTRDLMAENGTKDPELLTVWRFEYGQALSIPDVSTAGADVRTLPEYRRTDD
jgi:hypothetical protein